MQRGDSLERRDRVFELIVLSYIETAEPVGSRTISKRPRLRLCQISLNFNN